MFQYLHNRCDMVMNMLLNNDPKHLVAININFDKTSNFMKFKLCQHRNALALLQNRIHIYDENQMIIICWENVKILMLATLLRELQLKQLILLPFLGFSNCIINCSHFSEIVSSSVDCGNVVDTLDTSLYTTSHLFSTSFSIHSCSSIILSEKRNH